MRGDTVTATAGGRVIAPDRLYSVIVAAQRDIGRRAAVLVPCALVAVLVAAATGTLPCDSRAGVGVHICFGLGKLMPRHDREAVEVAVAEAVVAGVDEIHAAA